MRSNCLLLLGVFAIALVAANVGADDMKALEVYARGDYAGAVELLVGPYEDGSANIQQRILLARAYLHLDRKDDALPVLRSVLELDRENPEANALVGRILHEAGKDKEALEYLKDAYRLKQDSPTASTLGKCYYALGERAKAKVHLEEALSQDIRDPSNSFILGKICLERGQGALAEKYLLKAEEAGMETAELRLFLGRSYLLQHKLIGPVIVQRIPAGAQPGDIVDDHVVLAPLEGVADQYKVCTRYSALYEGYRLLEAEPQNPDALFMLASGWLAAGEAGKSDEFLRKLRMQEPESLRAADLEARILLARRDFTALAQTIRDARAGNVFDDRRAADLYYRAALVLRAEGKRPQALDFLGKAQGLWPTSPKILRASAELSVVTGRKEDAREAYARLVELFPDARDIDELRNALKVLQEETGAEQ